MNTHVTHLTYPAFARRFGRFPLKPNTQDCVRFADEPRLGTIPCTRKYIPGRCARCAAHLVKEQRPPLARRNDKIILQTADDGQIPRSKVATAVRGRLPYTRGRLRASVSAALSAKVCGSSPRIRDPIRSQWRDRIGISAWLSNANVLAYHL